MPLLNRGHCQSRGCAPAVRETWNPRASAAVRKCVCFTRFWLCLAIAAVVSAASVRAQPMPAPGGAAQPAPDDKDEPAIPWHANAHEAFDAAGKSGKPVFMFVYQPYDKACVSMEQQTLADPKVGVARAGVIDALKAFECVRVSTRERANRPVLQQFKVGPPIGPAKTGWLGASKVQMVPVSLFLGPDGTEYYRQVGYVPGPAFVAQLRRVGVLHAAFVKLRANPKDAVSLADVGHAYVELDLAKVAKQYLEDAIKADPAGAFPASHNAALDLAIISIPDDPQKALAGLTDYLIGQPASPRILEARYYMAVAHIACGNEAYARKLLAEFDNKPANAPEMTSPWGQRARELLEDLCLQPAFKVIDKGADPASAYKQFGAYLKAHPKTARRLEIRYYMAVAMVNDGKPHEAQDILSSEFEKLPPTDPGAHSEWSYRALVLLDKLRKAPK